MFKKKCFICKQKDEKKNLDKYTISSYDYWESFYYHKECLEVASCNARDYNNFVLGLVIDICDYIKKRKAKRAKLLIECNKICKDLKATKKDKQNG